MQKLYRVLHESELRKTLRTGHDFALDVLLGLSDTPKHLSSKYFYDARGSELFSRIMELPEYYLTGCEFEILNKQKNFFCEVCAENDFELIELGAGDGRKTSILLNYFFEKKLRFEYVPIDISESAVADLTSRLHEELPELKVRGLVAEYFNGLRWMEQKTDKKKFILFLGSNIGNFTRTEAKIFLRTMWNSMNKDDCLIIGIDLKKDIKTLLNAYDDAEGVTREFNLNLLKRINEELGGNFSLENFSHYANYNVHSGAMESYLLSTKKQVVNIDALKKNFSFEEWEPIHTEYSMKHTVSEIESLAHETGFRLEKNLFDSKGYFVDSIWKVVK